MKEVPENYSVKGGFSDYRRRNVSGIELRI
jgi:hypothetical protein